MLGVLPPPLFAEFWERGFRGHLLELSLDGSANFVVQAAFAAMTEAVQVTPRGTTQHCSMGRRPATSARTCVSLIFVICVCPDLAATAVDRSSPLLCYSSACMSTRCGDTALSAMPQVASPTWPHPLTVIRVCQVKEAIAELKDSFGDLLQRRRAGVVASLLAASGRLRAGQV